MMSRLRASLVGAVILAAVSAPAVAADQPSAWAVVVGIDGYENPAVPRCSGAGADAREIQRWLIGEAGWPANHVLRMDANAPKTHGAANLPISTLYPSRENLEWAVRDWLKAWVRKDDLVLIYFAGQAASLKPEPRARPGTPGRDYLLPIDARPDRLAATGWDLSDAIDELAAKGENPILLWLDTSPNGRGKPVLSGSAVDPNAKRWLADLTRWPGVSVWLASDKGPSPEVGAGTKHSPFVTALFSAIGPKAESRNLLGMLDRLNHDSVLKKQGFRTEGGLSPDLSLWANSIGPRRFPPSEILLQQGHAQYVSRVALTPDGTHAVSSSGDATVRVWRLEDRALVRLLSNHLVEVSAMALSSDGRLLASGDGAGALRVWRLPEFQALVMPAPRPHDRGVSQICISPDGRQLASLDGGGTVMLWEVSGDSLKDKTIAKRATALAFGEDAIAVAGSEGGRAPWLRLYRRDGAISRELPAPAGLISLKCLIANDGFVAYGDRSGRVRAYDVATGQERIARDLTEPVATLAMSRSHLAVGAANAIHILSIDPAGRSTTLPALEAVDQLAWSGDGNRLAATTRSGQVLCWDRNEAAGGWNAISLQNDPDSPTAATSIAFAPDGGGLVAGCRDGELRRWALPSGRQAARIDSHRGQIAALSVSPDGRFMLQVTKDQKAQIWDLQEGRSLRVIDGRWQAGAFLRDGRRLAMTDGEGSVRIVDLGRGTVEKAVFDRPLAEEGNQPTQWGFSSLTVSPDGRHIAATSPDGPLACVWKVDGGAPVKTIRAHTDFITSVQFAEKGDMLITAGLDGQVKAWSLSSGVQPVWVCATGTEAEPNPISAALLGPGDPRWLVTGHRDGRVVYWELGPRGALKPRRLGQLEGEVHALVASPDGRSVVAGGDDKAVWLWSMANLDAAPRRLDPRHHERVNALAAFPNGKVFASGSDDTTVKFWDLAGRSLLGTFAALPASSEWVVFTPDPDGSFDSSPGAEREITWLRDGKVMPLDQFYERYRVFRLADRLRQAERPAASVVLRTTTPPPNLAIDRPGTTQETRQVELAVSLGAGDVADLRLYHNGVPIRDDGDFVRVDPANPKRRFVRVSLRKGTNRFHALAARSDRSSIDGRSNLVEINYNGPDSPARLFVLALGVSEYKYRPLKYAADDARTVARSLSRQGVADEVTPENVIVLTDVNVTEDSVAKAFVKIRQDARPEDTVVLFLAGHADVRLDRSGRERFTLLLPSFPFPTTERLLAMRGGANERGGVNERAAADAPGSVLSYSTLYQQLIRVHALQRLVVIDACQAGAALEDAAVKRIQQRLAEKIDDEAHRARTSYIFASRKNEPAFEVESLKHGLLTHVLLRGMGAAGLQPDPAPLPPNADRDQNQIVTTDELRRYVDDGLPLIAAKVVPDVSRAGTRDQPKSDSPAKSLEVQSTKEREFDLVRIPKGEGKS
jgi:WD40 repeat protein/ribosome-binding factor A